MATSNRMTGMVSDYARLNTLPAMLSVVYILAGLYQFGGISTVDLTWLDYSLTTQHSVIASLGTMLIAGFSSETRSFDGYEDWEMVVIALGPAVILGHEYTTEVTDVLMELGDPTGLQVAFFLTLASWAVAVR